MKQSIKRIATLMLSIMMVLTSVPISSFATDKSDLSLTYGMKTGHSYVVPIKNYSQDGTETNVSLRTALYSISNCAIVTPEESGKYKVMIQANNYDKMVTFQIYKQGTIKKGTSTSEIKAASYGLDDYPYREKMIETGWLDASNDEKCYAPDEITVTKNDYSDNKYLTFEIDNLEEYLYTVQIQYVAASSESDWRPDRKSDMIVSCLGFDTSDIKEIQDYPTMFKNGGARLDHVSHRKYDSYNFESDGQKLSGLLDGEVTSNNDVVTVKLKANGDVSIQKIFINGISTSTNYGGEFTRYEGVSHWDELEINNNLVEIPYKSVEEAVYGREIHLLLSDGTEYYATLKLDTNKKETVSLSSNGVTLTSDSYNLKQETEFKATPVTQGTDYENAMSSVGGVSSAAKLYSLSFKAKNIAYTPNNRVTLTFDIPEDWDADKTQLYVFYADEKSSGIINSYYGETYVENGKLNYTTTKLDGYQYILFQKSDVTDVNTLSDGVYSVGVNIWNYEQPDSPSMANNAVKGGKATLHVYNNGANKDLYFDMQGITIPLAGEDYFGYMYRMFTYPKKDSSDNELKEVNITKYMVNDNGSADIDDFHLCYPESVALSIPETYDFTRNNTTLKNLFKINVIVPIMDGLAGGEPGDGASARDALVQLFDAKKIDGESTHTLIPSLKDVNKEDLETYIKQGDSFKASDYDSNKYSVFAGVLSESKKVYNDINSSQTVVDKQTEALTSAIETLTGTSVKEYKPGVYTADSKIVETDGTDGYHQGIAGETRIVVGEKGNATVYMTIEKAKTVFSGQELASYYIDGFLYKDGNEFKQATVLDTIEVEGTTYPTKISFPIEEIKELTQVGFYSDGDTSWVNEIGLKLTNIKMQNSDKIELKSLYSELANLSNDNGIYTEDSFNAITVALSKAKTVIDDPTAIQNEIDTQISLLKAAKNGLKELNPSLNLKEGVYTADSKIVETDGTDGYHQGIAGETRIVVDEKGNATVYMTIEKAKTVYDGQELASYYIDGFLYKDGNEFKQATVLDTIEVEGVTYPTKVSFSIGEAKELTQVGFYSDGDTSWVNEIGLKLSNPTRQNVNKSSLESLVTEAEAISNDDDIYTSDSYEMLINAIESAKAVLNNPVAIQKEINAEVSKLDSAKNNLKKQIKSLNLEQGEYTVDSQIVETDGSLGYHQGIAGETRIVVDEKGNATVYMTIEKAKTVYDGQELASYYIDGFLYKDGNEFKQATVLDTIEVEGVTYPTKVSFSIGEAKELTQVGFYSDGDTSWVNEIGLKLSNPKKIEAGVDKASLQNVISKAEAIDTFKLYAAGAAALEKSIIAANATLNKTGVTQKEIDKQKQLLEAVMASLIQKNSADKLYDGTYSINGIMRMATSDKNSMGNPALVKPMTLVVKDGKITLLMEFVPLTTKLGVKELSGYLAKLNYFSGWTGGVSGIDSPVNMTPTSVNIESYYEGVYDIYNNAENGIDENVKGKLYPHFMSMPVSYGSEVIWVQVYVPVMESIQTGNGLQYARLVLDWTTVKQLTGTSADKNELNSMIEEAAKLSSDIKENDYGYSTENIDALNAIISLAKDISDSINVNQTEVEAEINALKAAINIFKEKDEQVEIADKSELKNVLKSAQEYINNSSAYTDESINVLKEAFETANSVYGNNSVTQETVNKQVESLKAAIEQLKEIVVKADKTRLQSLLDTANKLDSGLYTTESVEKLKAAIEAANEVYNKAEATQTEVDNAYNNLDSALSGLEKKNGGLDDKKLEDGVYSINANMVKVDKTTASMSDGAINHVVKLTVKDGKYYLTVNFKGLQINSDFGYLSTLKYFLTGYTLDKYGNPVGTLADTTIEGYIKNADGSLVSDVYGTNYPSTITFELIPEALENGYVPLQVFVPIMEAIAEGNGEQPVFMKLDWSSLKKTTTDDPDFKPEAPVEQSPAVDTTDSSTGIRAEAAKGVFEEGVKLNVENIKTGDTYSKAETALNDIGKKFKLFNIYFTDADGNTVQPNGKVTISLPIPEGYDASKVVLYRINDDGTKTLVKGSVENGYYKADTKHFSTYALVEKGSTITDADNTAQIEANKSAESIKTGDSANTILWAAVLMLAVAGMAGTFAVRRRKVKEQ